jgi:hypothetical protein
MHELLVYLEALQQQHATQNLQRTGTTQQHPAKQQEIQSVSQQFFCSVMINRASMQHLLGLITSKALYDSGYKHMHASSVLLFCLITPLLSSSTSSAITAAATAAARTAACYCCTFLTTAAKTAAADSSSSSSSSTAKTTLICLSKMVEQQAA